ncbi:MAG TPA: hypothetical protein VD838_06875, partial [Anaeromyxobacteraceae bacterium]|nr:hypothetical protein [Anaeromyxobacteraceae bacterium]
MPRSFLPALLLSLAVPAAVAQDRFDGAPSGEVLVAERLPMLDAVLGDDAAGRAALHALARVAFYPETIQTTEHLVEAFALRDSTVAHLGPRVEPYFFEEEDYQRLEAFFQEAAAVGIEAATAEGFVFGAGPGDFLPEQLAALAPPDFALYQRFRAAHSRSLNGEYPFSSMEDRRLLVVLGERLVFEHAASPYAAAVREDFEAAVLLFTSLHRFGDEWFVGPATTSYYPWASTDESHRLFVAEDTGSRYHAAVAALLADPPEVDSTGVVEAVVVMTGPREGVERRVLDALAAGNDL